MSRSWQTLRVTAKTAEAQDITSFELVDPEGQMLPEFNCGPKGFIDVVLQFAEAAGWPPDRLRREYFTPADDLVQDGDSRFQVELAYSGVRYEIPADRSVVDILLANGVDVPVSCEQGVCGTCLTRVLQGVPDHRDMFMTDAEHSRNDQFTPCCSRAKSDLLVLDL
jgi:vanillate monooxygenase ferredoxin subunit